MIKFIRYLRDFPMIGILHLNIIAVCLPCLNKSLSINTEHHCGQTKDEPFS